MDGNTLLVTGMTKDRFDKAESEDKIRTCYFCGKHQGQEVVAIRNGEDVKIASLQVDSVLLSDKGDDPQVFIFVCTECGIVHTNFPKK